MTDQVFDPAHDPAAEPCPAWCACGSEGEHTHVSAAVVVPAQRDPLVGRLVEADGGVRVVINDRVATVEESRTFVDALRRLLDDATLAEPGLGAVAATAAQAGIGVSEMALLSGLDVSWVRAQKAGARILTVRELAILTAAVDGALERAAGSALGGDEH